MDSSVLITSLVLYYVTTSVLVAYVSSLGTGSTLLATASSLELEAQALLRTGWWSWYSNDTSNRCQWPLISCNKDGSVTHIRNCGRPIGKLGIFNMSCFLNLVYLNLVSCDVTGSIPPQIGALSSVEYLYLEDNHLTGELPNSLGKLTRLKELYLYGNTFEGSIPPELGNLKSLLSLLMQSSSITGPIPSTLGNLTNLERLNLGCNQMTGSIPSTLGNLTNLKWLDLDNNHITGPIPSTLGNLANLKRLNLGYNQMTGSIPSTLGKLTNLEWLDLSNNQITGTIPPSVSSLIYLEMIDLSYNSLEGRIPVIFRSSAREYFRGNKYLCGNITGFPPCASPITANTTASGKVKIVQIIMPIVGFLAFLSSGFLLCLKCRSKNTISVPNATKNGDLFSIWNFDGRIAFEDIVEATEDFDIRYCIGTGGYGSVYRAQLPSGKIVALKKLHRLEAEVPAFDKSFKNEAKILTEIRHKNIVKLYGFCLHNRCMFLIYEYMARGSLFCVLADDTEAVELDWIKRVKIIKDTACALSYLHHDCHPPIVH